ncbi:MAG: hypothetical protein RQ754_16430 [Desulfuromonadales bacterium]|nr:hypothetical protein [Desulfuromonadales bacterium]
MRFNLKRPDVEKCKDSGLALVLIFLICHQLWPQPILALSAIIFLLIAMTYPLIFQPFAIFWFALSAALGSIVSKVILTILFYSLVFPVGLVRRVFAKDSMRIRCWKKGTESVFRVRNQRFAAKDLEHPY